jgi:hypothetical protein
MAKAKIDYSTFRLSSLFTDPVVRSAFERAERDGGHLFAVPAQPPRVLDGGAAESVLVPAEALS